MSYSTQEKLRKIKAITAITCLAYAAYKLYQLEKEKERRMRQREAFKRKYESANASSSSEEDDVPVSHSTPHRKGAADKKAPFKRNKTHHTQVSHARSVETKFVACSSNQDSSKHFVSKLTDDQFKKYFRVSRSTVDRLNSLFKSSPEYKQIFKVNDKTKIPDSYYILMFLWFVGQRCSYLELSKRFNIGLSKSVTVVDTVLQFIHNCANDFIRLPEKPNEMRMNAENFEQISDFPDVMACLMHTKIQSPSPSSSEDSDDNEEVLFVQALCDSQGRFLHVYADTTQEYHPSEVLEKSQLNAKLKSICQGRYHALATDEHKVREWLLTPICEPVSVEEVSYNEKHLQTYQEVSDSLECLKKRFPKLTNMVSLSSNKMKKMIIACCVLQNICIEGEDFFCVEDPLTIRKFVTKSEKTNRKLVDRDQHLRRIGELKRKQFAHELEKSICLRTEKELPSNIEP